MSSGTDVKVNNVTQVRWKGQQCHLGQAERSTMSRGTYRKVNNVTWDRWKGQQCHVGQAVEIK